MTRKQDWLPTLWSDWGEDEASPFYALRKQIGTLLEDFDRGDLMKGDFDVRTNVSETGAEVRITAELPGIDQKDVEVEITGDTITLRGEKTSEEEESSDSDTRAFHRLERRSGSFRRMTRLPFRIDPESVTADMKDGVLTVVIPKPAEVRQMPRKVEIKTAA